MTGAIRVVMRVQRRTRYFNGSDRGSRRWILDLHRRVATDGDRHSTEEIIMSTITDTATKIRPFRVNVPDAALQDLRHRIAATRWPSSELVADRSQGVQLAAIRELARYWAAEYDWRKAEAKLNALPQFITEIDG